eukprot:scaffold125649_cov35-Attheya_sp.AAC.1
MFAGASAFNDDIGDWDVSRGRSFFQMFRGATTFNQDLSRWGVSSGINTFNMFCRSGMPRDDSMSDQYPEECTGNCRNRVC